MPMPTDPNLSLFREDLQDAATGLPVAGARVRVLTAGGALAPIFRLDEAGDSIALANPLAANSVGQVEFYANAGFYQLELVGVAGSRRNILVSAYRVQAAAGGGGGLAMVTTDASLTGNGSAADPLEVADGQIGLSKLSQTVLQELGRQHVDNFAELVRELLAKFAVAGTSEQQAVAAADAPTLRLPADFDELGTTPELNFPYPVPANRHSFLLLSEPPPNKVYRVVITSVFGSVRRTLDTDTDFRTGIPGDDGIHVGRTFDSYEEILLRTNDTVSVVELVRGHDFVGNDGVRAYPSPLSVDEAALAAPLLAKINRAAGNYITAVGVEGEGDAAQIVFTRFNGERVAVDLPDELDADAITSLAVVNGELVATRGDGSTVSLALPAEADPGAIASLAVLSGELVAVKNDGTEIRVRLPVGAGSQTGEEIRAALQGLTGDDRLPASAIKGLPVPVEAPLPEILEDLAGALSREQHDEQVYSNVVPAPYAPVALDPVAFALYDENRRNFAGNYRTDLAAVTVDGFESGAIFYYADPADPFNLEFAGYPSYIVGEAVRMHGGLTPDLRKILLLDYTLRENGSGSLLQIGSVEPLLAVNNSGVVVRLGRRDGGQRVRHLTRYLQVTGGVFGTVLDEATSSEAEVQVPADLPAETDISLLIRLLDNGNDEGGEGLILHLADAAQDVAAGERTWNFVLNGQPVQLTLDVSYEAATRTIRLATQAPLVNAALTFHITASYDHQEVWNAPETYADFRIDTGHSHNEDGLFVPGLDDAERVGARNSLLVLLQKFRPGDLSADPEMAIRVIADGQAQNAGDPIRLYRSASECGLSAAADGITGAEGIRFGSEIMSVARLQIWDYDGQITAAQAQAMYAARRNWLGAQRVGHPADSYELDARLSVRDAGGQLVAVGAAGGGGDVATEPEILLNDIAGVGVTAYQMPDGWEDYDEIVVGVFAGAELRLNPYPIPAFQAGAVRGVVRLAGATDLDLQGDTLTGVNGARIGWISLQKYGGPKGDQGPIGPAQDRQEWALARFASRGEMVREVVMPDGWEEANISLYHSNGSSQESGNVLAITFATTTFVDISLNAVIGYNPDTRTLAVNTTGHSFRFIYWR